MSLRAAAVEAYKSSDFISWRSTGRLQQTIAGYIEKTGATLHSGNKSTVRIWPEAAGKGRFFDFCSRLIPASIDFAQDSPLCTTLPKDGYSLRTVEHLLSALEGTGVDNCRIEIINSDHDATSAEVPIFYESSLEWVEAIEKVGLTVAVDCSGRNRDKLAPYITQPVYVSKGDSVIAAFPSKETNVSYGIDFPQVEKMRNAGLIKGGSADNALVFSTSKGLLIPPLRSSEEPCSHKILDFIGDVSLFARSGSQGLPVANIIAYKGGHTLHAEFVRRLSGILERQ